MLFDEMTGPARRKVVVVLGMHRSGTSAVAGCLQRLGIDFGPRLMPATPDNPRGYYEHIDVVNLHDRLLLALDRGWDDVYPFPSPAWLEGGVASRYRAEMAGLLRRDFPTATLWGLKDPRLCHLLPWWEPLWRAMVSKPFFVLVHRAPEEVATSLARREKFSRSKSYLLWLQHMLEAEHATRGHARVLIDFNTFVDDWRGVLERVNEHFGHLWPAQRPDEQASVGPFVDPSLVRSRKDGEETEQLPVWIKLADEAMRAGLVGREDKMRCGVDTVRELLQAAVPLCLSAKSDDAADLRGQLEAARRQARWYESEWQKAHVRADLARAKLSAKKRKGNG